MALGELVVGSRERTGLGRRTWLGLVVGLLAVLLAAETTARVLEPRLPEPGDWFSPEAARLVREMDDAAATGVHSDVLVTGSSQAGRDVVPAVVSAELGRDAVVHNVSLAKGGQALMMQRWLLDVAVPRLRPDTVVWGISSLDFNPARRSESIGRYESVRATRSGAFGAADRALARTSALARNRAALRDLGPMLQVVAGRDLSDALPDRAPPQAITFTPGRTRSLTGARRERMLAREAAQTAQGPLRDFQVGRDEIGAFRRTLRSLRDAGIRVHVAIMPVQRGYVDAHPNGADDYVAWRRAVLRAARAEGVPISDHTDAFASDAFIDFEHLGPSSAREFSRMIAAEIRPGGTAP